MKNKILLKTKKKPWIPAPAKTTKSPSKAPKKVQFPDSESQNLGGTSAGLLGNDDMIEMKDDEDIYKDYLSSSWPYNMKEAEEQLESLSLTQQQAFEASSRRLEKMKEDIIADTSKSLESLAQDCSTSPKMNQDIVDDISEQKTSLMFKLRDFEANSCMLRKLLKKAPSKNQIIQNSKYDFDYPGQISHDTSAKDASGKSLNDKESCNCCSFAVEEKKIALKRTIEEIQDENTSLVTRNKTLERNRANMQRELHRREAEMARLQMHAEISPPDHTVLDKIQQLEQEMTLMRTNFKAEKESLKKVIKFEKKKSAKSSEMLDILQSKLSEKKNQMHHMNLECDHHKTELEHLIQIRDLAESELSILRDRVEELETIIEKIGSKKDFENTSDHHTNVSDQEYGDNTKSVEKTIKEVEYDTKEKSDSKGNSFNGNFANVNDAVEKVHHLYKREFMQQFTDQLKLIQELSKKIEKQDEHIKFLTETTNLTSSDKIKYEDKLEALIKTNQELEKKNFEISLKLTKTEEALQYNQMRFEEKSNNFIESNKQLENLLSGARQQVESFQEKTLNMEKQIQMIKSESEVQLNRMKSEIIQLKMEKQEVDRSMNLKLSELRDRLEHSQSTNRSMQNYITFLKSSYANVFSDPVLSTLTTPTK